MSKKAWWDGHKVPISMLRWLRGQLWYVMQDAVFDCSRKARLLAVAFYRARYAMGMTITPHVMQGVLDDAEGMADLPSYRPWDRDRHVVTQLDCWVAAQESCQTNSKTPARKGLPRPLMADMIRDVLGDPFRDRTNKLTVSGQSASLAEAAYQLRRPDFSLDPARLAVLSDSLEDDGCDPALLAALRADVVRWRGFDALDSVRP